LIKFDMKKYTNPITRIAETTWAIHFKTSTSRQKGTPLREKKRRIVEFLMLK
jgi:hypothetical protein